VVAAAAGLVLIVGRVLVSNLGASFANEAGGVDLLVQTIASPFGIARIGLVGPAYVSPPFYVIVVAALAAVLIGEERSHKMWKTVLVAQPSRPGGARRQAGGRDAGGRRAARAARSLAGVAFGAVGTLFLPTDFAGDWGGLLRALPAAVGVHRRAGRLRLPHGPPRPQRRRGHDPGVLPAGPAGGLYTCTPRWWASSRSTASTCSCRASGCASCSRTCPPTSSRPTSTRPRGHRCASSRARSPPRPRRRPRPRRPARHRHHARARGGRRRRVRAALPGDARLALPARRHRLTRVAARRAPVAGAPGGTLGRHEAPGPRRPPAARHLRERVLVLDGAMGTMIQRAASARPTSAASASATTRATCAAPTTCWRSPGPS
jgi:hypothetical protein